LAFYDDGTSDLTPVVREPNLDPKEMPDPKLKRLCEIQEEMRRAQGFDFPE